MRSGLRLEYGTAGAAVLGLAVFAFFPGPIFTRLMMPVFGCLIFVLAQGQSGLARVGIAAATAARRSQLLLVYLSGTVDIRVLLHRGKSWLTRRHPAVAGIASCLPHSWSFRYSCSGLSRRPRGTGFAAACAAFRQQRPVSDMLPCMGVLSGRFLAAISISASAFAAAPTFTKDVAPILYARCAQCHRPYFIAPMSLLDYKSARPWANVILEQQLRKPCVPS